MSEDWLDRWEKGRTGWRETDGSEGLKLHWPAVEEGSRVLVPLCGNSTDLLWLAQRGYEVVGVELSDIAIRQFFAEHNLRFRFEEGGYLDRFTSDTLLLTLYCGDYFKFEDQPFDALFDRGALVALPGLVRRKYVNHTKRLLRPDALRLIITLEYEQDIVQGPPFSVLPSEIGAYWHDLVRVDENNAIDTCPPKFRAAGLGDIQEVVWLSD